ncbi:MAG: 2-hydroxyacyl-CoA dehydratase [Deltaproteobacteria bacterium]|nr:2-hydroxyacyl-CoA dehydratase [Deltaproteobacteria bacterium]
METNIQSTAFQEFKQAAETIINPEMQKWKDQGGKIMGYFCSSFPEELIAAAGLLPFRMRATGSKGTELSDAFFASNNCSFPRHAFNMALEGEFNFLDGILFFNSCDNVRRVYDHWVRQLNTPFADIINIPKKADPAQVDYFCDELAHFKGRLEAHLNIDITDDRLRETIRLYNESRRLLRQLYSLRKEDHPPITGAEALTITVASTAMPKKRCNELLTEFLDDINNTNSRTDYRARLMVLGGELDNPEFMKIIEDQGAIVVTDALCFGSKIFWKDVDENIEDCLRALAKLYLADRPTCPRVYGKYPDRLAYIQNMVRDFQVDGVIFERLAFCEIWGFEQFSLTNDFKDLGIPMLAVDREYTLGAVGQLKTRVQAFLETIGR